ncbi:MAG: hypothetical protein MUP21_07005 [Dehalococcoidia bacterium]|nr:hypothetical protein [Dehalococcoidia bacterium]
MSLSIYFAKKCTDKIEENVKLVLQKLNDPASFVKGNITGSLADAAKGGLGSLKDFAGDYLVNNAGALIVEAVRATGLEDKVSEAFNLANNILAAALMANNELVMFFVRKLAEDTIKELRIKQEILAELSAKVTQLNNLLVMLEKGNPIYDPYIAQLRKALTSVRSARTDLTQVRNTFIRNDLWLSKRFENAKASLETAKFLVMPPVPNAILDRGIKGGAINKAALTTPANNPLAHAGGIGPSQLTPEKVIRVSQAGLIAVAGLANSLPVPTTEQQVQTILAIPKLSREIITASQGYFETVAKINALIVNFIAALGQIQSGLPGFYKKYILSLFDPLLTRTDQLVGEMANQLNGSPTAVSGPIFGFKPSLLGTSVIAFKWGMDISLILENFKVIPAGALNALAISSGTVTAYKTAVLQLQKLDTIRAGGAVLTAIDAQEQLGQLESQLTIFLLEANNAIVSAKVRQEVLGVSQAILRRLALTVSRDNDIAVILDRFAKTPFELESLISQVGAGMFEMFGGAGLDNASDLLKSCLFTKFFKLSSKEATYVGAALNAVALLKQCLPDPANRAKLQEVQDQLERDSDLLSIRFSIDFDLAIRANLLACLRLRSFGDSFSLKEVFCGLINDSGIGAALAKLRDLTSF